MKIRVHCDCGQTLVASDQLAGTKTTCLACGAVLQLPRLDEVCEQPGIALLTDTELDLTSAEAGRILGHDPLETIEAAGTTEAAGNEEASCTPPPESMQPSPSFPEMTPLRSPPAASASQQDDETSTASLKWLRSRGLTASEARKVLARWQGLCEWVRSTWLILWPRLCECGHQVRAWAISSWTALWPQLCAGWRRLRAWGLSSWSKLQPRLQLALGRFRDRSNSAWHWCKAEKLRLVIVSVAVVLIAGVVVFPLILGDRHELKTEQIVARSEAAVAFIQGERGSGSGFLISPGLVITNAHVLDDEFIENIEIHFPSGTANVKGPFKAKLVYEDSQRDLAVVSIDTKATPLTLAKAFAFRRGQDITVIGSPGVGSHILKNAVSRGVMSTETEIDGQKFYQLGIAINPGNSGGPVFDSYGDVVGVVTARASKQEGLAFSVPLSDVRSVLAIASQPGAGVVETATSRHQVEVVSRRIASVSRILLVAMHSYNEAMEIALKDRRRAQDGLNLAQALLHEKVDSANARLVNSGVRALVPKVGADQQLSEAVRKRFVDLWTNYSEIRDYVDHPRGSSDTYRAKTIQLEDQHQRAVEALKVSLGLTDL